MGIQRLKCIQGVQAKNVGLQDQLNPAASIQHSTAQPVFFIAV